MSRVQDRSSGQLRFGGFTLVEVLVVLGVLGILGTMLSYSLSAAQQTALATRTRNELLNYGQLLQTRIAAISLLNVSVEGGANVRRAVVSPAPVGFTSDPNVPPAQRIGVIDTKDASRGAMLLRRDFLRMALPECQADLFYPPASIQFRFDTGSSGAPGVGVVQLQPPAAWNAMRRAAGLLESAEIDAAARREGIYNGVPTRDPAVDDLLLASNNQGFAELCRRLATPVPVEFPNSGPIGLGGHMLTGWSREHESSECLYLIMSTIRGFRGGTALDQVPERNVGDTDDDGYKEILDGWGRPVRFMRSPVGLQLASTSSYQVTGGVERFDNTPEPFDFLGSDFRLEPYLFNSPADRIAAAPSYVAPIVVSAGSDGEFGIITPEVLPADWSSSVVQLNLGPAPVWGFGNRQGPPYRYPDPYFPVRNLIGQTSVDGLAELTVNGFDETADAKRGDGMGGFFYPPGTTGAALADALAEQRDVFADNIFSYNEDIE